jgi:uncharacterized protein (TIGR02996 family)
MLTATHPALAGLLAAIIAEPDSDDLRLIYADFLEEHGEPERAEFVRVQLELTKAPSCSGLRRSGHGRPCRLCRPFEALRRREGELLEAHGARWIAEAGLPPGEVRIE